MTNFRSKTPSSYSITIWSVQLFNPLSNKSASNTFQEQTTLGPTSFPNWPAPSSKIEIDPYYSKHYPPSITHTCQILTHTPANNVTPSQTQNWTTPYIQYLKTGNPPSTRTKLGWLRPLGTL